MHISHFKKTIFVAMLALAASACDHAAQKNATTDPAGAGKGEFRVTSVNTSNFLINATDHGADVSFESDKMHSCQLYFIKAKFAQGYTVSAKHDPINITTNPNVDLTCSINNTHFSLAGAKTNYIKMSIPKVGDTSEIELNFSLSDIPGNKKFERKNLILHLNEGQTSSMH